LKADPANALHEVRLDEHRLIFRLASSFGRTADTERRMGPCRLGQIFYRARYDAGALDKENVGGTKRALQKLLVGRLRCAVHMAFFGQEGRQSLPKGASISSFFRARSPWTTRINLRLLQPKDHNRIPVFIGSYESMFGLRRETLHGGRDTRVHID
jgi:hypothetical protein